MKLTIPFLVMQLLSQASTFAQPLISTEESSIIKNQIERFYSWYIDLIKNKRLNEDFNPSFVKKSDGMTTLDFTNYRNGLKRFNFSDDFIQTKVNDYQDCVFKLSKVPFSKFSEYKDLDDFENLNCDFSNTYEWTGGMDQKNSVEISRITRLNKKRILATISFDPSGMALVYFKKIGDVWKIDNLTLEMDTNE
jgi:hypothetical protein